MNEYLQSVAKSLKESWVNFLEQIPSIILAILIISLGLLLAKYLSRLFKKTISKRSEDPLMTDFLTRSVRLGLIILVSMYALKIAGLGGIATGLLTAAGASAVVLGFAFKDIGENFISGVILSFNRPFNVNDTISIGDIFGKVKTMEFRYTKLKTFDGRDVYIPNSDVIKKPVFNYTEDGFYRLDFILGIAYEDNITKAEELILETLKSTEGVIEDSLHQTFIAVDELAVSTVNIKVFFWVETWEYRTEALKIRSDVIRNVKEAIVANGLNMPADIKEIKLYDSQKSIPIQIENHSEASSS